jgi:hypothetical protein
MKWAGLSLLFAIVATAAPCLGQSAAGRLVGPAHQHRHSADHS